MGRIARRYYWWARPDDHGHLLSNAGTYDGVMAGAGMIADGGARTESLLAGLGKPYFVDPATHRLAIDPARLRGEKRGKQERSLVRRIGEAGGGGRALAARLDKGPLRPLDFGVGGSAGRGSDLTGLLAAGTIAIQRGRNWSIADRTERPDTAAGGGITSLRPEFLVAPYFYARNTASEWFDVNVRLFREAARQVPGAHAVVCLDRGALFDERTAPRIAEAYSGAGGLLVWISGFDDTRANVAELRQYAALLRGLAGAGRPIIALYAGHFATLLSMRIEIRGVVRGLDMNGCRNAVSAGGPGQPRYYLGRLHVHVPKKVAAKALRRMPTMRCRSAACAGALSAARKRVRPGHDPYGEMLAVMGRGDLKGHFMHAQKSEADRVAENRRSAEAMALDGLTERELKELDALGVDAGHIRRWAAALARP